MQKVLNVTANPNSRNRVNLADSIEKQVAEFISSVDGKLEEFAINTATLSPEGFGHALVTVKYTPSEPKPANTKKGG